jgi:beta-lactamase class A
MKVVIWALGCAIALTAPVNPASGGQSGEPSPRHASNTDALSAELHRIELTSGGDMGVAARLLEGGSSVALNGQMRFPMASTFKVAVAATVLGEVDGRRLALDKLIAIDPDHYVDGSIITDKLPHRGVALAVENLLELMLTESDNTATDALMSIVGGPPAITVWLRTHGLIDMRVDRNTAEILRDYLHLGQGPFKAVFDAAVKSNPAVADRGSEPDEGFDNDPRDTSTPIAMLELITRVFSGTDLSPSSTKILVDIMARCRTGEARIRGLLPKGTPVAHKTGSISGTINDVGVVTLPDGRHLAIVVFIKKSGQPVADRERAIAETARAVRDYFVLRGG